MEVRNLKFGKIYQKYLIMHLLSYVFYLEDSKKFFHQLTIISRKFFKYNLIPIKSIFPSKWMTTYEIVEKEYGNVKIEYNK